MADEREGGGEQKPRNPHFHEIYEQQIREYLSENSFDPDAISLQLASMFNQTVLEKHRQNIGDWIEANRIVMGKSQIQIADHMNVDVSSVTKWINGKANISLANLSRLKSYFAVNNMTLCEPDLRELMLEGYRAAITLMRSLKDGKPAGRIARHDLLCLYYLHAEPDWGLLWRRGACDCEYRPLAHSLLKRSSAPMASEFKDGQECQMHNDGCHSCRKSQSRPDLEDVKYIKLLKHNWGIAWLICVLCISREGAI